LHNPALVHARFFAVSHNFGFVFLAIVILCTQKKEIWSVVSLRRGEMCAAHSHIWTAKNSKQFFMVGIGAAGRELAPGLFHCMPV
jgi:hypothetical protein